VAQPPKTIPELLGALEGRSYDTYKSRIYAFERIQSRNRAWNTALIALATATTVAALGLLVDGSMYGDSGETFLAACSVLSLSASLVIAALDYPGRAVRMENAYKDIQDISSRVEGTRTSGTSSTLAEYNALHTAYSEILRHSENHTTPDYEAYKSQWSIARVLSLSLTLIPYVSLVLPAWLMWQFGDWVIDGAG
jgi:hypothetical protein